MNLPESWRTTGSNCCEARYNSRLHWFWLRDQVISNQCSEILTHRQAPSANEWTSFLSEDSVLLRCLSSLLPRISTLGYYVIFFITANANRLFITESNKDNIIQQPFWKAKCCITDCFSQTFRLRFNPRWPWKNDPRQQTVVLGVLNDELVFHLLGLVPAHLPWPHSL